MVFRVDWHPEAQREALRLPVTERHTVMSAVAKLEALGDRLGTPHTSQVKGSQVGIRELRPRAGRSPWRAFYRRVGDRLAVLAVGP